MSKKPFEWDENTTAEVVAVYKATLQELNAENGDPDTVNTGAAVAVAASAVGTSPASARIKLSKEGVYIKVQAKKSEPKASGTSGGGKRLNKAEQQAELVAAFADLGVDDLDMEIIEKLTGKAAGHLASKVRMINSGE